MFIKNSRLISFAFLGHVYCQSHTTPYTGVTGSSAETTEPTDYTPEYRTEFNTEATEVPVTESSTSNQGKGH